MAYKSGNPALSKKTFENINTSANVMSLEGVASKSIALLIVCFLFGVFGWNLATKQNEMLTIYLYSSMIIAFIIALVTIFNKKISPYTAPLYAVFEGFALGVISQMFDEAYSGIVLQALLLTGGIFVSMLVIYLFRLIKVTENFKLGLAAATGGIALYYVANLVFSFFGRTMPLISSNSVYGIAFSIIVICIAALNLVADFDFIEHGVEMKAPKYMEWYSSFGLLVTIVWLYLEILRLLAKVRSR